MKKFLIQIFIFLIMGYLAGEGVIRIFNLSVDVPNVYQDEVGLTRNEPNQEGYYINGNKWLVTNYGEFGYAPPSLDSLITIIGDSYIANMMNPPECNQAAILASHVSNYNFYPSAREGASFVEMLERAKSLEHLKPIKQIFFVHQGDFVESVKGLRKKPHTIQVSLESGEVIFPKLSKSPRKKFLHHFKFAYYLFRNHFQQWINSHTRERDDGDTVPENYGDKEWDINYSDMEGLLEYSKKNYNTDNIILVFYPDSDLKLVEMAKKRNFETLLLKVDDYKSWQLPNDMHWSCHGHQEAAKQVAAFIMKISI